MNQYSIYFINTSLLSSWRLKIRPLKIRHCILEKFKCSCAAQQDRIIVKGGKNHDCKKNV